MQKIRKILRAVSEKTALLTNQPTNQQTNHYQQHRPYRTSLTPVQKVINSSFWNVDNINYLPALNSLSMKLSEHLTRILHADIIEMKARDLLNNSIVISCSPSITDNNTGNVYLVAKKASKVPCKLSVTKQGLVKCNCKGFTHLLLFSHSVVISEKGGFLSLHIVNGKKNSHKKPFKICCNLPDNCKRCLKKRWVKEKKKTIHTTE